MNPAAGVTFWVDLDSPSIPESLILSDTMGFHPLSVEDAMSAIQYPKVEAYDGYLYLILHDIDFTAGEHGFKTHDVDFFLGPTYLVTVHHGTSRAISELRDHCPRNSKILGDGPVPLLHRVVDTMVDHYRPEIEKLEERLNELEDAVFENPTRQLARQILDQKRDVSSLRRVTTPQRDVVSRLARREFVDISTEMSFRFRDVYDHVVRVADDAFLFQDRITGILDADLLLAAQLDVNDEAAGAGVDRVLDQLLDDGRRALDDFTRRDLVGEVGWEAGDAAHLKSSGAAGTATTSPPRRRA